jgi:flavin-dependent dehydrogenase
MMPTTVFTDVEYDVVICGGGLAGLCLGKQLKDAQPALSVLVCERVPSPLPRAAFKVGESSVEVGAYYMSDVVGMRDYLNTQQLEKLGLRYFYPARGSLADESEFGVDRFLPAKSYQLDRGTLEDHLRSLVVAAGAVLVQGVRVEDISMGTGGAPHTVSYRDPSSDAPAKTVSCRWVVDAMGRRKFLRKKFGLEKKFSRRHNAVWFRLGGRLDVDEAVSKERTEWHARVIEPRWHSTNHFMFDGGWVWAIPLFPDQTSVGIVTTEALHPIESFNTIERAMDFVAARVPAFDAPMRELPVLDFLALRDYSYSALQVFSADRWACVGEAGTFADPYYSVGSNMIAYANGFVVKMISDDIAGRLDPAYVDHANRWFLSLAEALTNNIQVSYPFHGNPVLMALKTIWDFYIGWAFSDPQYYAQTFLSVPASVTLSGLGAPAIATQARIMDLLTDWSRRYRGALEFEFIDYLADLPTLTRLYVQNLPGPTLPPFSAVLASVRDGLERIEELAHVIFWMAVEDVLPEHAAALRERGWLNVSAISLDPDRWETDGLFAPRSRPRPEALRALEHEIRTLFRASAVVGEQLSPTV